MSEEYIAFVCANSAIAFDQVIEERNWYCGVEFYLSPSLHGLLLPLLLYRIFVIKSAVSGKMDMKDCALYRVVNVINQSCSILAALVPLFQLN